jgi:predicted transcriptional regulator YdeE
VPSGRYAVVTSAKGPVERVVPKAWQQVYSLEDNKQLGGARAYKADFELYDQRSQNPQDSQVDLYVGVK